MSSEPSSESTRDYTRVALVMVCVLATVLAAALVPALSESGVNGSPAESAFPGEAFGNESEDGSGPGSGGGSGDQPWTAGGSGGLGALNPGSSTDVGGSIGGTPFQSQETTVHMTVESTRPAYWRTGAYDTYTGTGWERSDDTTRPYSEPVVAEGIRGEEVSYRVTLNRSATALPTVWRPAAVGGADGLEVTEQGAITASQVLEPGATYTGTSYKPPRDPSVLRSAGQSYPAAIERRYATLSEPSPRLADLTDEITANADTPYEKATAIENWLESNKRYSLNASRTSGNIAETFVLEMERGYCEYFATSMAVMLRTQDVPARYVVGYSTGQQVGGNTYQVRAMNAHAWVEVYFEDVGWVKFDPTPGSARLQEEQAAIEESDPDAEYNPLEEGSPGETFTPDNETNDAGDDETGETITNVTDSGYEVTLNRSAVPGATVEVTVTRDSSVVSPVEVYFNGKVIGTTDGDGTVVGTVPYDEQLRISVEPSELEFVNNGDGNLSVESVAFVDQGDGLSVEPVAFVDQGDGLSVGSVGGPDLTTDRFYSLPPPESGLRDATFPVETNATVTVSGDALPGNTVTVSASVDDVPVPDAAVLVDGEQVATTDANGRATVDLPERSGEVTVAVERDPVYGARTLSLPALNVSVDPVTPIALPFAPATVNVTAGGDPVSGATVGLDGTAVTTTGIDGTASVTLPFASGATVAAAAYGLTAQTTVSGLFWNLGLLLGGLLAFVGGPVLLAARRGYSLRDVLALVGRLPAAVIQYAQWVLVALATRGDELFVRAIRRLRRAVLALADLFRGRASGRDLLARLRAWLRSQWLALRQSMGQSPAEGDRSVEAAASPDPDRLTVQEAWGRFLQHVSLRRPSTRTPGEIARHAITRDGLPREPVTVLRDAFREVEYGERSASDRADRAEEAVARIEHTAAEDTRTDGGERDQNTRRDDPRSRRRER